MYHSEFTFRESEFTKFHYSYFSLFPIIFFEVERDVSLEQQFESIETVILKPVLCDLNQYLAKLIAIF